MTHAFPEEEPKRIARNLTRGQWLVLLGPRKFGNRGGPEAEAILKLGLVSQGRSEWPLTPLGKRVINARPTLKRSALAEKAKRAFDRNAAIRETATIGQLAKMIDPWEEAVIAVYSDLLATARAEVASGTASAPSDIGKKGS